MKVSVYALAFNGMPPARRPHPVTTALYRAASLAYAAPMTNLLDGLKALTVVVADTGDIGSIRQFLPRDATTNPSLITAAAQMPEYDALVQGALTWARARAGDSPDGSRATDGARADITRLAIDRLAIEFGLRILEIVPGRVSTEVDARLSFDVAGTIAKARWLIGEYEAAGTSRERVLIKIAATWEGIRAAELLEQEGIHCNLTLLFGMHQAVACAEAGVTLISPFVGRILDWNIKASGRSDWPAAEDPGVVSVTAIYHYFKRFGFKTEIMGASFRNSGEILELAGCDLLTISPKLLSELAGREGEVPRKLDPAAAAALDIPRIAMDEATFRAMHEVDRMANDKLAEGIDGFTRALVALEKLVEARIDATA